MVIAGCIGGQESALGERDDPGDCALDGHPGLAPPGQSAADLPGIKTQDVTNPFERHEPVLIGRLNPRLRLCKQHLAPRVAGARISLVALDRIFQHSQHQAALRQRAVIVRASSKVLVRQDRVRLEQA